MRRDIKFTIARDEGGITVFPDHPIVREFLTLQYREMVKERGRTVFRTLRAPMYDLTSVQGHAAIFSHQGFWKSLVDELELEGFTVDVQDKRAQILDPPNYAAALQGLREFQKPWILKALMTGNSGLIGAPTRFGKSWGMTAIARAFPNATIVVTAPGVDLCQQLLDHFREVLPNREVVGVFTGSRNSKQSGPGGITICSVDSLPKMDPDATDILMGDEPHALVSEERLPSMSVFTRARKFGFGATLNGRFDRKDPLITGLFGPVLANVTYKEAVALGAIAPLKVLFIKIPFSKDTVPGNRVDRDIVYQRLLTQSTRAATLVRKILHEVIPDHWQTMAFIKDEKQALFYLYNAVILPEEMAEIEQKFVVYAGEKRAERKAWQDDFARWLAGGGVGEKPKAPEPALTMEGVVEKWAMERRGTIAMAKRMKTSKRRLVTKGIVDNDIWRVLASNIYVQGLTFPDLKVVLNLAGGGANTTAIQKPGRLLQARPGKNYGVMLDFMFECRDFKDEVRENPPYKGVIGECWARHRVYKEIGYDIEFVDSSERVREVILGAYQRDEPSIASPGKP